ncbi:MAG TPA: serine/threonine-protein kinase [Acidimicrobiales bacterium]|nr:serine/threonine-protein kinase [Acidimicrobiales bacterium]
MRSSETPSLLAGRFRIGPLLGRGGMAEVYDGHDERLQRPVAVKLLRSGASTRPDVRRRFEAEARSAARLIHRNAVAVFDSGEEDGVPFLVMERLPGTTLADRIAGGPLDADEARRIAIEVLAALAAAHRAGIVHRDVKPANVLLDDDGTAKVADFGIAKSLDVDVDLTSTDQVVGTPAYVAPERIGGERATPAADIYSVGVVLYEMLTGQKAFPGANAVSVAYRVRHEAADPIREVRPDVPPALARVVERAMAKDPAGRYRSADEMAAALAAAGEETTAVPLDAGAVDPGADATSVLPVVGASAMPLAAAGVAHDGAATPAAAVASGALDAPRRSLLADRRVLAALGVAALLIAIGLLVSASTGHRSPSVASELRHVASSLTPADGPGAPTAAAGLRNLADAVGAGRGGPAATSLLRDLAVWRDRRALTPAAVERIRAVVVRVPGVDVSAFSATTTTVSTTTTTTAPVVTPAPRGHGKGGGKGKND